MHRGDPGAAGLSVTPRWDSARPRGRWGQLARPEALPAPSPGDPSRSVMAAEYCDLNCDKASAPYVTVRTVTFDPLDTPDPDTAWGLQFNAWNTLPELSPLWHLFQIRQQVHAVHSEVLVPHLFGEAPGATTGRSPLHEMPTLRRPTTVDSRPPDR